MTALLLAASAWAGPPDGWGRAADGEVLVLRPVGNAFEGGLLAPDSWPDAATLQRWPQARLLVVDPAAPASGLARLDCSDGPLLDAPALPVLDAGRPLTLALPVAGGVPPFIFEAEGLPDSVRLTPEGILESDGTDFGSTLVTVTLVDAEGATWSTTEPLHASTAAACGPDAGVLRCGEEVADAPERVCLEATGLTEADWAVVGFLGQTRDEVAVLPPDPGDVEPSTFVRRRDLVLRRGGGVPLADLDAYEGLPVALRVRSDDPSPLCLRCGIGPLPDRPLDDCRP